MKKGLYTVELNVENNKTAKNKKTTSAVKVKKSETEELGVAQINNSSSRKRVKKNTELGYEKHTTSAKKKAVSAKVTKQDDYFDFDFRAGKTKIATEKQEVEVSSANHVENVVSDDEFLNTLTEILDLLEKEKAKIKSANAVNLNETTNLETIAEPNEVKEEAVLSMASEEEKQERAEKDYSLSASAESCKVFTIDDDAEKIISVAYMGSLFDYVKNY